MTESWSEEMVLTTRELEQKLAPIIARNRKVAEETTEIFIGIISDLVNRAAIASASARPARPQCRGCPLSRRLPPRLYRRKRR